MTKSCSEENAELYFSNRPSSNIAELLHGWSDVLDKPDQKLVSLTCMGETQILTCNFFFSFFLAQ